MRDRDALRYYALATEIMIITGLTGFQVEHYLPRLSGLDAADPDRDAARTQIIRAWSTTLTAEVMAALEAWAKVPQATRLRLSLAAQEQRLHGADHLTPDQHAELARCAASTTEWLNWLEDK